MDSSHTATSMTKKLQGKVAIVTGGASGIGASTVRMFKENGATVVIADVQEELGRSLAEDLGSNVSFIRCDVSVEEQVQAMVETVVSQHGKLDIMYNNAGILDRFGGYSILDTTPSDLNRVLQVNLCGAFYGAKHAARVMTPKKQGCILFTASTCTSSFGGVVSHPYVMSKYGIMGLVRNLSAELGQHGIRVNCISPSGVGGTGMHPFNGYTSDILNLMAKLQEEYSPLNPTLTPDLVAKAALYLASDDAYFVNAHNLVLDADNQYSTRTLLP